MNNCEHYFEWGYTLEPIVYCIKCNKELDDEDLALFKPIKTIKIISKRSAIEP